MCGCGKRGSMPRRLSLRPTVGPRPIQGGVAAGLNPTELRNIAMQNSTSLTQVRRMDENRRRIEKIKRDAIRKKLNKG